MARQTSIIIAITLMMYDNNNDVYSTASSSLHHSHFQKVISVLIGHHSTIVFLNGSHSLQSINQLINQSINHSINQSTRQSISQSVNQSTSQSINQSIKTDRPIAPVQVTYSYSLSVLPRLKRTIFV